MTGLARRTAMKRGVAAQVVLLPGGQVGAGVLDKVELWSAEGLLDPVFWVPADMVHEHHTMPAQVSAIVFGRRDDGTQERREVPLLATLGRENLEELIVTSVRWLSGDEADWEFVSRAASRLLIAIKDAMPLPRQIDEISIGGTKVRSLNLVFASTKVSSDELAALVSNDWEENILVSPEDRQRPNSADRFTDAEDFETWAGFVAASVASLSGLWTGFASSPISKLPGSGSATQVPRVRVARTFARAVVSGDFSVELARSVAAALANPVTPLLDPAIASQVSSITALDPLDVAVFIDSRLQTLIQADDSALSYKKLQPHQDPKPSKIGAGKSFKFFWAFSWDKLISIPVWTWNWFADTIGSKTKSTLYGKNSSIIVDARSDLHAERVDRDLMETAEAIEKLQSQIVRSLNQPPLPIMRTTSPTLWSSLRAAVFSLVDGGSDNTDFEPIRKDGKVAVVSDVGMVIPAPWDVWLLPTDAAKHLTGDSGTVTTVEWTDLASARGLLDHLTERSADLDLRHQEMDGKVTKSRLDLISSERDYVEARELFEDFEVDLDEAREMINLLSTETVPDLKEDGVSTYFEPDRVEPVTHLEQQVGDQKKRVLQAERAVSIRRQRLLTNRDKRELIRKDLAHLTAARDSLGSWLHERSQSLGLKLLDFVDNQEKLLKSDEKEIRSWAEMPISTTAETAAKLRQKYARNLWLSLLAAVLIPAVLFGLNDLLNDNGSGIPWFESIWWRYLILGLVVLFVCVFMSLTAYHRGYYIKMKVEMDLRLAQGRYLLGAIEHIRMERARIEGLAPQLRDRLQFFGAVLQEPWRVPRFGGNGEDSERLNKGLPALFQIAKTAHSNDPTVIKLRARYTAEQYQIGMRRKAIDDLLREAADKRGIPREQVDLQAIDRDSTTYGLRAALQDMVRDPEVLESIGRSKVSDIALYIQREMTPLAERPGIVRINVDTLQGLSVNHDLLAQWSTDQMSWDDYVVEILEDGAALSRLAFSSIGTAQSRHLKFKSIAVAPVRLHSRAGQSIEFIELDSGVVTGTEIVARIDITPAMDVREAALFEHQLEDQWTGGGLERNSKDQPETYDDGTL